MIVHLNGQWLDHRQATVSIWDGGFLYGDGVYTTLRLYAGRALDLPAHHRRLVDHGATLGLTMPLDLPSLGDLVAELARRNDLTRDDGRLRITLSRGADPERALPLDRLDDIAPTLLLTLTPVSPELATWQRDGISVLCLPPGFARGNLPELKTLNGLTTVLALRLAARAGCLEAILTGGDGHLLEGAVSNLFVVRDGEVATPGREGTFLPGRTRERIIELLGGLGMPTRRLRLTCADLETAAEVFVASSVREILPVVRVGERPVGDGSPGPVTRRIQTAYRQQIAADLSRGDGPAG